jgi:hypothetical protein
MTPDLINTDLRGMMPPFFLPNPNTTPDLIPTDLTYKQQNLLKAARASYLFPEGAEATCAKCSSHHFPDMTHLLLQCSAAAMTDPRLSLWSLLQQADVDALLQTLPPQLLLQALLGLTALPDGRSNHDTLTAMATFLDTVQMLHIY